MRALFNAAVATATSVVLLSACGGGGDSPTPSPAPAPTPSPSPSPTPSPSPLPSPSPSPTPAPAQISSTNYLNPYWLALIAGQRIEITSEIIDVMFSAFVASGDTSGSVNCSGGGSVSITKSGAARSLTVPAGVTCVEGDVTLFQNSAVSSPDAQFSGVGTVVLTSGTFNFSNVSYRSARDPVPTTETLNGQAAVVFNSSNGRFTATGSLSFLRNAKTDAYTGINAITTAADPSGVVTLESATLSIGTPRFATALVATGSLAGSSIVVSAPDGSNVTGVTGSGTPTSRTYTLRSTAGGAPVASQTLADTDPAVQAALANALN
jgi:hypothetical protein